MTISNSDFLTLQDIASKTDESTKNKRNYLNKLM